MTKIDYYTFGLGLVNLYFLETILISFSATNLIAIFDNKLAAGYVTLATTIIGILFIIRNCTQMVTYVSGNVRDENKYIRLLAVETLLVIISYIVLTGANTTIFYIFNSMV